MSNKSIRPMMMTSRLAKGLPWCVLAVCLAVLVVVTLPQAARAQGTLGPSSFVDTVFVDSIVLPSGQFDEGDTVWVGIGVDHDTADVVGVHLRLVVPDTNLIRPARELDGTTYFVPGTRFTPIAESYGFTFDSVGVSLTVATKDTTVVQGGNTVTQTLFNCLLYDLRAVASLPIGKQRIFEIPFVCKAGITVGQSVDILVRDATSLSIDNPFGFYNEISYPSALESVYPVLGAGMVAFGSEPPPEDTTNTAPVIAFDPTQTTYNITQGETVEFSITATDPDTTNDMVTLSATLPSGATFTPSNPVTGTVTATGDFSWTPNFSQEGTFSAVFSASDDKGGNSTRAVTIIVEKQLVDILFTSSSFSALPRGGIPGKAPVLLPIDVLATRVIYGLQFDVVLDGSAFRVDSIIPTEKLTGFTMWDNIGHDPDTVRVIAFSVAGDSIPLGGVSTVMNFALTVDSSAVPASYPVVFVDAVEAITRDPGVSSIPMSSQDGVVIVDRLGDVNLDTLINVADMVGLTSYILGSYPLTPRSFDAADVNVDSSANVIDLVAIINAVLGLAPIQAAPVFDGGQADLNLVYGGMEGDDAVYYLEGTMPTDVAGMELSLTWDPDQVWPMDGLGAGVDAQGMTMRTDYSVIRRTDRMKIVAYYDADASNAIRPGSGRYLKIPVHLQQPWTDLENPPIKLASAVLSDVKAAKVNVQGFGGGGTGVRPTEFVLEQNYPNPFNPQTTIAFTISAAASASEHVTLTVYNVLGRRVTTLVDEPMTAGQYEVVWDGRNAQGTRVASGLYLYRLVVGDKNETRKMVLLK